MPGGDRTGPQGEGPKTGRGLGYCNDNNQSGDSASQRARGFGRRGGRGRSLRRARGAGRGSGRAGSRGKGQGQGRMGGPLAAGPNGYCVCPGCGHKVEHIAGRPCNRQKCPECGTQMTRE
jgi:hypothetical protein